MTCKVVLSLDFELRWGLADVLGDNMAAYRYNLEGVREVVPRLLELFSRLGVHATWATVAAIALQGWDEYAVLAPPPPLYLDAKLAPSRAMPALDPSGRLHFAPDLVAQIAKTSGQELASHSFSHFLFGEPGAVRRDAEADARAVASLFAQRFSTLPRSFVFPRNQIAFLDVLTSGGIQHVRTNPETWVWHAPIELREWGPLRAARFAESFVGVRAGAREGIAVPASAFLRLSLPEVLFLPHRVALAKAAAKLTEGEFLHLWFHPHNLGAAPATGVGRVETTLAAISDATGGRARFLSMAEA